MTSIERNAEINSGAAVVRIRAVDPADRSALQAVAVLHEELLPFTRWLVDDIAPTPAVAQVLDLYRRGEGLPIDDALRLEAEHAATQRVDPAAFGAAGAAAAARQQR